MNSRVCLIGELRCENCVVRGGNDFLCLLDSAAHAVGAGSKNNFRTVSAKQYSTFSRHGLGHCQNNVVSACCTNHCKGNTGVSRSPFDNGTAGLESSGFFSGINDGAADAVFHRACGVVEFELDGYVAGQTSIEAVESNKGSLTNSINNAVYDLCHSI